MAKLIILLLLSFQILALEYGECVANPSSKKYIDADFHTPFPKTISFSCVYECLGNVSQKITAKSSITVRSMDEEALNLVCQGVVVKKSKWGYEFDHVQNFFVYDTNLIEINKFGKSEGIAVDTQSSLILNEKMAQTLMTISNAYKIAGQNSEAFLEASLVLEQMSTDFSLIDSYIEILRGQEFKVSAEFNAQNLVFNVLLTSARHRIIL